MEATFGLRDRTHVKPYVLHVLHCCVRPGRHESIMYMQIFRKMLQDGFDGVDKHPVDLHNKNFSWRSGSPRLVRGVR